MTKPQYGHACPKVVGQKCSWCKPQWEERFDENIAPYLKARMDGIGSRIQSDIDKTKTFIKQQVVKELIDSIPDET